MSWLLPGWGRLRWERQDGESRGRLPGKSAGKASAKVSGMLQGESDRSVRSWRWAVGVGLTLILLHVLLFPPLPRIDSDFPAEGGISDREIRAPFSFKAPLLPRDIETRKMEIVLHEPPVLKRLAAEAALGPLARFEAWRDAVRAQLLRHEVPLTEQVSLLGLGFPRLPPDGQRRVLEAADPEAVLMAVVGTLTDLFEGGVVDMLPSGNYEEVVIVDADGEQNSPLVMLTTQSSLAAKLPLLLRDNGLPAVDAVWVASLARHFIAPNLVFDQDETLARQNQARDRVPGEQEFIKGERIIDQGVRVTAQARLILIRLHEVMVERGGAESGGRRAVRILTRLLILAVPLGLYGWVGAIHFPELFRRFRYLSALGAGVVLFLVGAAFSLGTPGLGEFAVPIPLLALLATVLFKDRVGYSTTLLVVVMLGVLPECGTDAAFVWLTTGLITVVAVRRIRKRSQFYRTIALLTASTLFLITIVRLAGGASVADLPHEYVVGLFMPIVSVALALFLLPVVEPIVGVSSDLTLLELSDLNHPLLKRMALEAQGTYHHCQVVSQLGEQAARAIGANALLTRAGALFHDIGKLGKPEYFVENQRDGLNKHDELTPSMSALVVEAHVKDGIDLARKWRLPQAVIDFIPAHHGTSVMEFFYHKALEKADNETVKVDDFRYPGPKPHNRETGIVMLADTLEAATRALAKPTPGRIREITKQIVDKRLLSGQLDETNLTIQDLAGIREACIPLLTGIHHARIAYPGQKGRTRAKASEAGGERRGEG